MGGVELCRLPLSGGELCRLLVGGVELCRLLVDTSLFTDAYKLE